MHLQGFDKFVDLVVFSVWWGNLGPNTACTHSHRSTDTHNHLAIVFVRPLHFMMLSLRAAGILRAGPATARAAQLRKLASVRAKCRPRTLSSAATSASPVPFAVAFDIDGVLVRGGNQIPGAGRVLEYLVEAQSNPNVARRVPFVFLTNGGGCMEDAKSHEMSDVFFPELPVPIRPSQVRSGEKEKGMGKSEERN